MKDFESEQPCHDMALATPFRDQAETTLWKDNDTTRQMTVLWTQESGRFAERGT